MKKKQIFSVAAIGVLSLLLVAGVAAAAVFTEDNTFTGTVNSFEKGIKIGKQGTGGVTFFNGTIVNDTTTDGANNPVTFGDNVRIDGRVQRGTNQTGDTWGVIVDDGLEVNKTLMVSGEANLKGGLKFDVGAAPDKGALATPVANFSGAQIQGIEAGEVGAYTKGEADSRYMRSGQTDKQIIYGHQFLPEADCTFNNVQDGQIIDGTCDNYTVAIAVPVGGTINAVDFYYLDDNAANNVRLELMRSNINTLASGTVLNTSLDVVDSPLMSHKEFAGLSYVVNDTQKYWLHVQMTANSPEHQLYGARVTYTRP